MSNNNNSSNQTQANQDQTQSYDNDTVTGVEVVKDDTVVYEDGAVSYTHLTLPTNREV